MTYAEVRGTCEPCHAKARIQRCSARRVWYLRELQSRGEGSGTTEWFLRANDRCEQSSGGRISICTAKTHARRRPALGPRHEDV